MSTDALPCIVCGTALRNVFEEAENQPSDGVACTTNGNYGSTVWDPLNGEFLEFNICDPCLTRAGEQGRVYTARTRRPVVASRATGWVGVLIGWEEVPYRPVLWHAGLPGYDSDDYMHLDFEDMDNPPEGVHLDAKAVALLKGEIR